ncbi:hypothetical protein [Chryseobacterium gregarium]|uniref:hypothetical protein n=1 Tax=Chryseobacterium gregarium TaxID=456299 RepID=UPI0004196069|nr:hypothetical protein [Chryseobacterium gregarium]
MAEDSKLGLRLFKDISAPFANEIAKAENREHDLNSGFIKVAEKRDAKNEIWQLVLGEKKITSTIITSCPLPFIRPLQTDRDMIVKFMLFNDGLGFVQV